MLLFDLEFGLSVAPVSAQQARAILTVVAWRAALTASLRTAPHRCRGDPVRLRSAL